MGCQWESPEEERREVGCQSESAERRDAAVQVDLLSQQLSWRHSGETLLNAPLSADHNLSVRNTHLSVCPGVCGVAWQCVSVRADEPGGGALLQHCSSHRPDAHHGAPLYLLCSHHGHTPLPTMPQYGPPAPPDLLQTASPPSMPLCGVSPSAGSCEAPPPGLIAPLSEEDEEEEEGSFKHEKSELLSSSHYQGHRHALKGDTCLCSQSDGVPS